MKAILASTAAAAAITAWMAGSTMTISAAQDPAEAPLPQFEASIKRSQGAPGFVAFRSEPAGRTMTGVALRQLIVQSYGIQQSQLIGGPDWIATDMWDILLRADAAVTPAQVNLLTQRMMADRFKLVMHRETREMPVFELRMARADGRPGPELKPSAVDCAQGRGARPTGPAPPGAGAAGAGGAVIGRGGPAGGAAQLGGCGMLMGMGRIEARGQSLMQLTSFLASQMGRPVIDKTGLTGSFDLVLSWTPDGPGRGGFAPPPGAPNVPIDPDGPPLVTALQEQLGLKLESTRGPVEVLVIDSVEQPTEN